MAFILWRIGVLAVRMSEMNPLIIVNPKSGRGLTEQKWASITLRLRKHLGAFDYTLTNGVGAGIRIAEEEARKGRRLMLAMGGDGTISEVVTGIIQSGADVEFGILPRGTGGDFRRTLDLSGDLEDAARKFVKTIAQPMDVGRISYVDHQGHETARYFVNTASFGASGKVAGEANRSFKLFGGKITFAAATLKTTFTYDHPDVSFSIDDREHIRLRIITIFVANGRYTGGGMKIAPEAKLNDGLFDIVTVGDFKLPEILANSYKLYTGTHLELDKVNFMRAKKLHAEPVDSENPVLLEVDGETPGRLPATFEIVPAALRIRA